MMRRREFALCCAALAGFPFASRRTSAATPVAKATSPVLTPPPFDEWIRRRHERVISAEKVDRFLRPPPHNQWAKFDPELGYVPSDSIQRDGIDGSHTVYRYGGAGERRIVNYAGRPCRVNTYGNSFTQCHQVSDGETWQESLAAHLGEPIRNFGVGGYGVFQAYARLRRMEQTNVQAPFVVFNIYDDDHARSIMPWRGFMTNYRHTVDMYHGNPWAHLRVNLDSGQWEERPSVAATPVALRGLVALEATRALVTGNEIIQLRAM